MNEWSPADIKAHIDFQHALNAELTERGELVDVQGAGRLPAGRRRDGRTGHRDRRGGHGRTRLGWGADPPTHEVRQV
jgi:hypothetical protein